MAVSVVLYSYGGVVSPNQDPYELPTAEALMHNTTHTWPE
jgi:hypothetical protein